MNQLIQYDCVYVKLCSEYTIISMRYFADDSKTGVWYIFTVIPVNEFDSNIVMARRLQKRNKILCNQNIKTNCSNDNLRNNPKSVCKSSTLLNAIKYFSNCMITTEYGHLFIYKIINLI